MDKMFFPKQGYKILISLFLILVTLGVYLRTAGFDFVSYDDPYYVSENKHVQAGLTAKSITWAFNTRSASNWHPLTWLSLMLDYQLFGVKAGGYHLVNVFFHIINTLLLFWLLHRMTGALWRSGFVAAAFALHPLHVESVAWIAERKDVLSGMFWLLTMAAYLYYVRRPGIIRYLIILLVFALGLMAKPMLVTLPFVLLLLDWWPLGRLQSDKTADSIGHIKDKIAASPSQGKVFYRLVLEKIPFFVLSLVSCIITFLAQRSGGTVVKIISIPLESRVANIFGSYINYISKIIWPHRLAVLYPYPDIFSMRQTAVAVLVLLILSIGIIRAARNSKYLLVGWLWYLGTLIPVIGLVQVGSQAMADRYTYLPSIGIFIMISWGLVEIFGKRRYHSIMLTAAMGLSIAALAAVTYQQLGYWRNSIALYERSLEVTERNYIIHCNYAQVLFSQGRQAEAVSHYHKALQIFPRHYYAHNNLGTVLTAQGKYDEAIDHFQKALRINPGFIEVHYNLGNALASKGEWDGAINHYRQLLLLKPDDTMLDLSLVYNNLALTLEKQGKLSEAIEFYRQALRINPKFIPAQHNLAKALQLKETYEQYNLDH